jgi:hypothetical protein
MGGVEGVDGVVRAWNLLHARETCVTVRVRPVCVGERVCTLYRDSAANVNIERCTRSRRRISFQTGEGYRSKGAGPFRKSKVRM